ncbi:MAG: Rpn family recombination-promoting nuclease/putative transposase, partial [Desulfobacteraceae bacterium]|nr:Rpn family recombination-promoting nuclease/putative transposase [Desulfobacteraceae bacterium]
MTELLTPKLDLVFKMLFTYDTELLADLISSVLKLSGNRRIRHVKVKNPIVNPDEEITRKYVVLDIVAADRKGRQYDVEMQISRYDFYPKRTLFYACRLYTNQLASGMSYEKLMPVIGIHFLDYIEHPEYDRFHFCFALREENHPELLLTDDMALHMIELPKFEEKMGK